jgi:hypothetical protein
MTRAFQIVPDRDQELAIEFWRNPIGQHSPRLIRLLSWFRSEPIQGRFVFVCTKPHREWVLGRLTGRRGEPTELLADKVFTDLIEANREVFRLRWERCTGQRLSIPDADSVSDDP